MDSQRYHCVQKSWLLWGDCNAHIYGCEHLIRDVDQVTHDILAAGLLPLLSIWAWREVHSSDSDADIVEHTGHAKVSKWGCFAGWANWAEIHTTEFSNKTLICKNMYKIHTYIWAFILGVFNGVRAMQDHIFYSPRTNLWLSQSFA